MQTRRPARPDGGYSVLRRPQLAFLFEFGSFLTKLRRAYMRARAVAEAPSLRPVANTSEFHARSAAAGADLYAVESRFASLFIEGFRLALKLHPVRVSQLIEEVPLVASLVETIADLREDVEGLSSAVARIEHRGVS